jgi:Ca2+-binding EF-hand superfamily protein
MRQTAVAVCVCLTMILAWPIGKAEQVPAGPVLLFPRSKGPFRLGLDVRVDGQLPTTAWDTFLDRLFDFFDRDGDGSLSQAEVSRIFPFPLPGGKELTIDFDKLDADGNGKGSRAELKAFCRSNGFGPVVVIVEPPSTDDLRLAELFLRRLDADNDGKLTRAGWQRAPHALRKYDLNEDEFLDLAELITSPVSVPRIDYDQVKRSEIGKERDTVLRLDVGVKAKDPIIEGKSAKLVRLVAAPVSGSLHRLYGPEGRWLMAFRSARTVPDVGSAREFIVAQFKTALGERVALTKADLEQDPALSALLELFRYADRNGDEQLSLAELEGYFKLVERGMRAQVWIKVMDHGQNPFYFLDTDGDGRLSYRELARASDLMNNDTAEATGLPRQFQLSFGGPSVRSWGGVPVPGVMKRPPTVGADTSLAPRWFQVMDGNGDGVISPREFVGPPEVFRKLDADGDGVISPEEARRAGNH